MRCYRLILELSSIRKSCLERHAIREDGAAFRAKVLSEFSGTLYDDEIHLGHRVVLLASDSVADNPIACALVSSNDASHMERFLRILKNQRSQRLYRSMTAISRRSSSGSMKSR